MQHGIDTFQIVHISFQEVQVHTTFQALHITLKVIHVGVQAIAKSLYKDQLEPIINTNLV